jgi:hypothetical protein
MHGQKVKGDPFPEVEVVQFLPIVVKLLQTTQTKTTTIVIAIPTTTTTKENNILLKLKIIIKNNSNSTPNNNSHPHNVNIKTNYPSERQHNVHIGFTPLL